jgi:hypothetical protein
VVSSVPSIGIIQTLPIQNDEFAVFLAVAQGSLSNDVHLEPTQVHLLRHPAAAYLFLVRPKVTRHVKSALALLISG